MDGWQVLSALELLLLESGGCLSDVYGEPFDDFGALERAGSVRTRRHPARMSACESALAPSIQTPHPG